MAKGLYYGKAERLRMENYSYKNAAVRVCFDNKYGEEFCGSIFTPYREKKTEFHNVVTLLMELDAISEERGFPNASCICRSFKQKKSNLLREADIKQERLFHTMEEINQEYGKTETFLVYVTSRMHANIQGHVVCVSDETVIPFESEIEFTKICEERIGRKERTCKIQGER